VRSPRRLFSLRAYSGRRRRTATGSVPGLRAATAAETGSGQQGGVPRGARWCSSNGG